MFSHFGTENGVSAFGKDGQRYTYSKLDNSDHFKIFETQESLSGCFLLELLKKSKAPNKLNEEAMYEA